MKKLGLIALLLAFVCQLQAQDKTYQDDMQQHIAQLDTIMQVEDMQRVANYFEEVGKTQINEWLPPYYAAYSYINLAYMIGKKSTDADTYLRLADAFLQKADALSPDNSEIYVLKAYCHQAKIAVSPDDRQEKQGDIAGTLLDQAEDLNPENPRIYYLIGQSLLFSPPEWGGGKEQACPFVKKAAEKFTTFQLESPLHPNWGRNGVEVYKMMCEQ